MGASTSDTSATGLPPVVVLTGPTAAGKSALAISLARRFAGELINADSQQVYRYMDLGTAKPTAEQRALAPHHLIDIADPDEQFNAGRYAAEARAALAALHAQGRLPILVGGTGLYIRAALEGLGGAAGRNDGIRRALEDEHAEALRAGDALRLHRRLAALDAPSAARLHPNDSRRVIRALEIHAVSGRRPSELRSAACAPRYRVLHLALDPGGEELQRRIAARCDAMIEAGLLREVRGLRRRGYGPELPAMRAIGYRHMQPVVDGADTLANVLPAMKRDTWRLVRRQRTWLRGIPAVQWFDPRDEASVLHSVAAFAGA